MKRGLSILLSALLALGLFACKSVEQKWQEQYDTGMRYLSELNYEEAIVAFTAAIEAEPKNPAAYLGRAEAYVAKAKASAPPSVEIKDWPEELVALYKLAENDYLAAIGLDKELAEAYLKLADLYIEQGEMDKAREILEQGLEEIGENREISDRLTELEGEETQEIPDGLTELESEETQGIPVESAVISGDLELSGFQATYEEGGEMASWNEGAVGGMNLSYTVNGPAGVVDVLIALWSPDAPPPQEAVQDTINQMIPTWKNEISVPADQEIPFTSQAGHPVFPDELGHTAYVLLIGLDKDCNAVAYTVIEESIPG